MFERFTEGAIRSVDLAEAHARELAQPMVTVELLLLGVMDVAEDAGAAALRSQGVTETTLGDAVTVEMRPGPGDSPRVMHFDAGLQRAFDNAYRAALRMASATIGTHHLLLGVLTEPTPELERLLARLSIDVEALRAELLSANPYTD